MIEQLKDQDRLRHMLEAALKAMEIVGEAAGNVSEEFCQKHSEIPWKKIAGTRNRLIHGYFDVDLDIIWKIVTTQLPPLVLQLKQLVA
jgi:uncharacterized protein with HEPN domain